MIDQLFTPSTFGTEQQTASGFVCAAHALGEAFKTKGVSQTGHEDCVCKSARLFEHGNCPKWDPLDERDFDPSCWRDRSCVNSKPNLVAGFSDHSGSRVLSNIQGCLFDFAYGRFHLQDELKPLNYQLKISWIQSSEYPSKRWKCFVSKFWRNSSEIMIIVQWGSFVKLDIKNSVCPYIHLFSRVVRCFCSMSGEKRSDLFCYLFHRWSNFPSQRKYCAGPLNPLV